MISREEFHKTMDEIKKIIEFDHDVNKLYRQYRLDGFFDFPNGISTIIKLLNHIFKLTENDLYGSDIDYFIFELEFGTKWKPGMIEEDGKDIDFSTVDKLYDYLTKL